MTPSEMEFLMATLETDKKTYRYFKDKYALDLLSMGLKNEMSIASLKKSELGFLTNKEAVKQRLSKAGNKKVDHAFFKNVYNTKDIYFNYTLGKWGEYFKRHKDEWYQTSRSGLNLVLQLNFDESHNCSYSDLIRPGTYHPYVNNYHPVKEKGALTMAWARLDIDLNDGAVLIEEIQTDWLREAKEDWNSAKYRLVEGKNLSQNQLRNLMSENRATTISRYYEESLKKYVALWDEAVLNLAIHFSVHELGCKTVYYNTFETGNYMKGLDEYDDRPPKSLYTKLPKKFGFKTTDEPPAMLKKESLLKKKLKKKGLSWYLLTL
ncbi:MAG: hypothetical protein NXI20_16315 [bacterium]|nr:hypothetical protein [bacterium]